MITSCENVLIPQAFDDEVEGKEKIREEKNTISGSTQ